MLNTKNVIFWKPVEMFYHPIDRYMGLIKKNSSLLGKPVDTGRSGCDTNVGNVRSS